jgi:hypothetical protein
VWHRYVFDCVQTLYCELCVDNGFRIYNVDPFRETFRRVFSNGGSVISVHFLRHSPFVLLKASELWKCFSGLFGHDYA